jgi:hypothetical protein
MCFFMPKLDPVRRQMIHSIETALLPECAYWRGKKGCTIWIPSGTAQVPEMICNPWANTLTVLYAVIGDVKLHYSLHGIRNP